MSQEEIRDRQLKILDLQLIGCILYIVSLIISIVIILNERKRALGQEVFMTQEEVQTLALLNKYFILILILLFLYLSYESYQLVQDLGQNTDTSELQIIASYISIIVALIGIYVVSLNYQRENERSSEVVDSDNAYS